MMTGKIKICFSDELYSKYNIACLKILSCSPIQFLTTGGGSKAWRGIFNPNKVDTLRLFYDGQGFISLQLTKTDAKVVYYDVDGNVIHTWSRTKDCCHPYI